METVKLLLGFLLGGSKWPLIGLSVLFLCVGGYAIYTVNSLQEQLKVQELNNEIAKSNLEKLEKAKEEQDKTIKTYGELIKSSTESYKETIKLLQQQAYQNSILLNKISKISAQKIKQNPELFEMKINQTMQLIHKCYEELSKVDLKGNEKNEIPACNVNNFPDFSK